MIAFEEWWMKIRSTLPERRIERCKPLAKMAWQAAMGLNAHVVPDLHLWSDEQIAELKRKGVIAEDKGPYLASEVDYSDDIPF